LEFHVSESETETERAVAHIRPANAGDARTLARLRAASLLEQGLLGTDGAPAFEIVAEREFSASLRDGRVAAWLLDSARGVRGCASALFWERLPYAETALHAELAGVYVEPSLRGRGFARALCLHAIAAARARGVRSIRVHPSRAAGGLYRDLGFVDSNELRLT
jgi:GNAT superfamily N-acetyltransferase